MSTSFQNGTFLAAGTEPEDGDLDDEGETDPDSVEEYVWNLMGKTGLLSEIKSRIAQFIHDNGKLLPGVSVIPSRADPIILNHIFEYLQWVGMKNTASLLLSESPFNIETSPLGDSEEPALCGIFEKINKSTRLSGPNHSRINPTTTPLVNKTFTSKFMGTPLSPTGKDGSFPTPLSPKRDLFKGVEFGESFEDNFFRNDEISINSMQSMQSEPVDSPTQTPGGNSYPIPNDIAADAPIAIATNIDVDNENDKNTSKVEKPSEVVDRNQTDVDDENEKYGSKVEEPSEVVDKSQIDVDNENEKNSSKVEEPSEVVDKSQVPQENDDSISDLLDSVQLDDDTQDISIDSDSRGMSSCEHVVNLK